jgi:hypothetical protein
LKRLPESGNGFPWATHHPPPDDHHRSQCLGAALATAGHQPLLVLFTRTGRQAVVAEQAV